MAQVEIRTCQVCGCTDDRACFDDAFGRPCHWVEIPSWMRQVDICSACAGDAFTAEAKPFVGLFDQTTQKNREH